MSAASEREKVLAEFMPCSREVCNGCELICQHEDGRTPQAEWMADEIIRLRAQLTRMACPTCGTVNPPEVHTCTPRPRVTVTDRWAVVDADGDPYSVIRLSHDSAVESAQAYDQNVPESAPHTVKRVALIDTGEG